MAGIKMTFSVDAETAARLTYAADALRKPKSQVVREAIADYADRVGRLSETERRRMLDAFDQLVPAIPAGPEDEVRAELAEIRRARRAGGRGGRANGRR
jgi:predicted transcriptional regulator